MRKTYLHGLRYVLTLVNPGKAHVDPTMNDEGVQDRAYRLVHSVPGIKRNLDVGFLCGGLSGSVVVAGFMPYSWTKGDWIDRVARGFCLGGAIGFSLAGGVKVAIKMLNKTLVMA